MRFHMQKLFTLLSCLLLLCGLALAQATNGELLGTIKDSSGGVIPAKIVITEINTGIHHQTVANADGNYTFPSLPPGTYRIEASFQGFKTAIQAQVPVAVNSTERIDLTLQPGQVEQSVTVSSAPPVLQTDRADTGRHIPPVAIHDLPIGTNRNVQSLLILVPGASKPYIPHSKFFDSQGSLSTSVNGQSRISNSTLIDGINDDERTGLLQVYIPAPDAVQEVDVTTGDFDAEYGRAGGAVTNITLKSGTNDWHGNAFEYFQNSALQANPYFFQNSPTSKPPIKPISQYNQMGGSIGGPIHKDKLFLFADYEFTDSHHGNLFRETVPTAAYRQGDFSAAPTTIYDPASSSAQDGSGRTPFANNTISASRLQSVPGAQAIQKLLSYIPLPNLPGLTNNYQGTTTTVQTNNQFDVKVDDQRSDKDRISVRYSYQRPKIVDPGIFGIHGGPSNGGFNSVGIDNTHQGELNYTRSFSPSLLAEFRFGISRYRNDAKTTDYGTNASQDVGISGVNVEPFTSGLTTVNINNGYSNPMLGFSGSLPWVRTETDFTLVNNWTKIVGNHTIKWGVDVRRLRDDLLQLQDNGGVRGAFSFNAGATATNAAKDPSQSGMANAMAAFLLDLPSTVSRDLPTGNFPALRQTTFFSFIQDKWQITPKWTLDFGLRHEIYEPLKPRFAGGLSNYDPATNSLLLAGIGQNSLSDGVKTHWKNFAPRLGAAYRFNEKTVVRAGYGITTVPFLDNSYAFNYPVKQNVSYISPTSYASAQNNGNAVDFGTGLPAMTVASIPSNGIIPVTGSLLGSSFNVVPTQLGQAYLQSWDLAVQRALPFGLAIDLAYVGNHGVGIQYRENLNAATAFTAPKLSQNTNKPLYQQFGFTGSANSWVGLGNNYNGLQVKVDRHFQGGLALITAYSYGKAIDYGSDGSGTAGICDPMQPSRCRGRSDFDRTQIFTQSFVYQLPFGKGKRWATAGIGSALLGGWQMNGILTLQSGTPLNFTYSNGSNTVNSPGNTNYDDLVGAFKVLGGIGPGSQWFDPAALAPPPQATPASTANPNGLPASRFGDMGRNMVSGPGFGNLDFSLFRTFPVTERVKAQLKLESFNFTNTPQFSNPNTDITNSQFGKITGTQNSPRYFQLGLNVTF